MTAQGRTIHSVAEGYLGLQEFPGARHNERIVQMFAETGPGWVDDDDTPWCAAFVGSVLAQTGMQGTGQLNARSYLEWGEAVDLTRAKRGDIVVFWRVSRDGWQGHVGFYHGIDGNNILVLGGNQGNAVSVAPYSADRLLGVRRAAQPRASATESRTVQASAAQMGTAAVGGVTAVATLDGNAQLLAIGACIVFGLLAAFIMRERLKKWARGIR